MSEAKIKRDLISVVNTYQTALEKVENSNDVVNRLIDACGVYGGPFCKEAPNNSLELCEESKTSNCKEVVYEGVVEFCKQQKQAPECEEWLTTTTTTVPPTTSTSSGPNLLPFIIGGVVGVVVLLAVAIGLFCYCRKKKKMGKNQSMTGTTTGGTSGTGTGKATGTTTKTGRTQATGTNTCAKY